MIRFGPSGNSESFYEQGNKSTEQMPAYVAARGLNAFEYSFGRGTYMQDEKALLIQKALQPYDIAISVHAPYFINLANPDEAMLEKSFQYLITSAKKLLLLGGNRCIFHAASCGKSSRDSAVGRTKEQFYRLNELAIRENLQDVIFCPETMGKRGQIGTIEEIVSFCQVNERFLPCVDFGHINAFYNGGLQNESDYRKVLDCIFDGLGEARARKIHVHFSKIQYTKMGEVRHLTLADTQYGPEFLPLAHLLKEYRMLPIVICESAGVQAEDAMELKKIYENTL